MLLTYEIYKTLPWKLTRKKSGNVLNTCSAVPKKHMYRVLNVHKIYPVAHDCCGWCSSSGSGLPLPWRGSLILFSQEGVVCAERDLHKAELPPYFCHPHRKHHRWHHNLTEKGGGVTSLSHKKHHRSENLEKENKKSSRTSLFIIFTIGIWKIVWCEMFVSVTISFLRLWGVSNCKYWSVLSLLSNFWNITPCRIISWSHKCMYSVLKLDSNYRLHCDLVSDPFPHTCIHMLYLDLLFVSVLALIRNSY